METHLVATEHHLPYEITYPLIHPTQVNVPHHNASQKCWYSICLPRKGWKAELTLVLVTYRDSLAYLSANSLSPI